MHVVIWDATKAGIQGSYISEARALQKQKAARRSYKWKLLNYK